MPGAGMRCPAAARRSPAPPRRTSSRPAGGRRPAGACRDAGTARVGSRPHHPRHLRMVTSIVTWLWELASAASVEKGADQDAEVAFVDAGDCLAEADGFLVGEAGCQSQHALLSGRAWKLAGVEGADCCFPVDGRGPGAVADEASEVDEFSDRRDCQPRSDQRFCVANMCGTRWTTQASACPACWAQEVPARCRPSRGSQ